MPPRVHNARHRRRSSAKPGVAFLRPAALSLPATQQTTVTTTPVSSPPQRILNPGADPTHVNPTQLHGGSGGSSDFLGFGLSVPHLQIPFLNPRLSPSPVSSPIDIPNPLDLLPSASDLPIIGGPISAIGTFTDLLKHPDRLLKIIGGGVLILMGLHLLSKQMTGDSPVGHAKRLGETVLGAAALVPKGPIP